MEHESIAQIKHQIQQLDSYDFEKLIAEVWELQGYQTTVRSASRDRGIDIEAEKQRPVSEKVLIQAKRYSEGNKVSSKEVRKYATLYQQVSQADNVIIVTSSEFTSEAVKLARDLNVEVIDGTKFAEMIKQYQDQLETRLGNSPDTNRSTSGINKSETERGDVESEVDEEDIAGVLAVLMMIAAPFLIIIYISLVLATIISFFQSVFTLTITQEQFWTYVIFIIVNVPLLGWYYSVSEEKDEEDNIS